MRGGALPVLGWVSLLALAGILNAVWTGDAIQSATFGAAVLAITLTGLALILRSPQATRRGEPDRTSRPEAIPVASLSVAAIAIGLGVLAFGIVFGTFPILLGAGIIVAGLGRLAIERHAQHRALESARHSERSR